MEIIIYIIGGLLAGLATGLVGLSAATIIAPLFATVIGMDPYVAIGIALASDVFASAGSTFIYVKNKNISIKAALSMVIIIVVFTFVGSYISAEIK
ncbi:MAG: TSUP family transporter, partial [Candidatus Izemoplasmatales bacterium]|nr:TSUP family transporter [Candidatus Izemoplasmatales bacterium]